MKVFFVLIGILAIVVSIFFFYQAYDKYANYYQSSLGLSSRDINVYVGGDAYNYIINGNYFTGFSVLGVGSLLLGMLCIGIAYIYSQVEESKVELQNISKKMGEAKNDLTKKAQEPS